MVLSTTGSGSTTSTASVPWTTQTWAALVLADAGLPVTQNNVDNLARWIAAETSGNLFPNGSPGDWLRDNNPLNVDSAGNANGTARTEPWGPGGSDITVYGYNTAANGAKATAFEITKTFPVIAEALQQNSSPAAFGNAVSAAGWAQGGYGGANIGTADAPLLTDASGKPTAGGWVDEVGAGLGAALSLLDPGFSGATALAAGNAAAGPLTSTLTGIDAIGHFFSEALDVNFWKRAGIFVGGLVLIGVGLVIYFESTDTGKQITQEAATAALL